MRKLFGRPVRVLVPLVMLVLVSPGQAQAAGDRTESMCPNEALSGFRPYLAACRAYEQITPSLKDGYKSVAQGISPSGALVLTQGHGAAGAAESDQGTPGTERESRRGASGWETVAISPSAAVAPAQNFFFASVDLEKSLWAMRSGSQSVFAEDLYVRDPTGTFTKVGPLVPPSLAAGPPAGGSQIFLYFAELIIAGASQDLSHIVFEPLGTGPLWPFDETRREGNTNASLYEYTGVENARPTLVAVDNSGHQLSRCGAWLGSAENSQDVYGAVSQTAGTIYFTAVGHTDSTCEASVEAPEVSELYARLDGVETVAISEPSIDQCSECNTGERRPAEFQGAAIDGSKALFLTEQELLPGATGQNLYEYDFDSPAGHKIIRVSEGAATPEVQGVGRISEDGSHVYFVAKGVLTHLPNAEGNEPTAGSDNMYVFERDQAHPQGRLQFIASLSEQDATDWGLKDERQVQVTPDGGYVVFQSVEDLVPDDSSSLTQVFEYDAATEELARVSRGQNGYPQGTVNADAAPAAIPERQYAKVFRPNLVDEARAISTDGKDILFGTEAALTPDAEAASAAGAQSVYEYRSGPTLRSGDIELVSDGVNPLGALPTGLSTSGSDALFQTAVSLLPSDEDTQRDLYDARTDGGFAASTLAPCQADACQGAYTPPSASSPPATSLQPAGGNLTGSNLTGSPSPAPTPPKPKTTARIRAQKLAKALKVCRAKHNRHKREACQAQARKRYGPIKAKKASHTTTARRG